MWLDIKLLNEFLFILSSSFCSGILNSFFFLVLNIAAIYSVNAFLFHVDREFNNSSFK